MKKLKHTWLITGIIFFTSLALKAQTAQEFNLLKLVKTSAKSHVTSSGLICEIEKTGTGTKPSEFNKVNIRYSLLEADGAGKFIVPETTVNIPLDLLPYGMQEGLKLMPIGSIWNLTIPPKLAGNKYRKIGNGNVLLSRVELISVSE